MQEDHRIKSNVLVYIVKSEGHIKVSVCKVAHSLITQDHLIFDHGSKLFSVNVQGLCLI